VTGSAIADEPFLIRIKLKPAMNDRPTDSEYDQYYAGYIARIDGDVRAVLEEQKDLLRRLAKRIPPERETYRYSEGKWSIREVIGHMTDGERVFGYRAFCISRGDQTPLPGFDENRYIADSDYDNRSLHDLIDELIAARDLNLHTFRRLSDEAWSRMGTASGYPVSVRALAYITAGHLMHHVDVLASRYGVDIS
jgi:hypothetical protein